MENEASMSPSSSNWMLPSDVMRNRRLKAKRRALHTRLNTSLPLQILSPKQERKNNDGSLKRKNPFARHSFCKVDRPPQDSDSSELSCDADVFQRYLSPLSKKNLNISTKSSQVDEIQLQEKEVESKPVFSSTLQIDWSLKSKVRLTSSKPLPWKHTFRSSEEASGTTGFARCLDPHSDSSTNRTLDTSKNAQFYQCCLTWQHPNLPMVSLFPRTRERISSQSGIFGNNKTLSDSLLEDWKESLRSLFHLLRVRQCPFFYVCGTSFTCLFRAAGIAGIPHAHVLVTPTTFGLREEIKKEGIEFTMPLISMDETNNEKTLESEEGQAESLGDEAEEGADQTSWLEDLGIEASKIPTLNQSKPNRSKDSLRVEQLNSMIFIEDMELHGFFNFLLNCTSCMSITGPLAGVPPTLLSPVAFHGGTLKALKVAGGPVKAKDGKQLYYLDLSGPILPSTVLNLSSLFSSNLEEFSFSVVPVTSSLPFSNVSLPSKEEIPSVFAQEGLIDCGLSRQFCAAFCNPQRNNDLPPSYREVSFSNNLYTWR